MYKLLSWYCYNKSSTADDSQIFSLTSFPEISFSLATNSTELKYIPISSSPNYTPTSSPPFPISSLSLSHSSLIFSSKTLFVKYPTSMDNVNIKNSTKRDEDVSISMNENSITNKLRKDTGSCEWCHKTSPSVRPSSKTNSSSTFCSEICFTKYRRANFKRSKRCDWCHHIKSSVNCIDLQGGDNQYQFCSDKCLNQFKLDIFCQETKEHLDIHPYHRDQVQQIEDDSSASLITPDLWLKNCSSPRSSRGSESPSLTNYVPFDIGGTLSESFCTNMTYSLSSHPNFLLQNKETVVRKTLKQTTKKKKNRHKLRNLLNSDLGKQDGSFSIVLEKTTPKISFRPHSSNTTTVSADHIASHENVSLSQNLSPLLAHRIQKPTQKNCLSNNLPVPPLLPINVSSEFSSEPISTDEIKTTPVHPESLPTTSLIPPPMLLIPYPFILPVFLPIPIPIPIPVSVTNDNADKENELEYDKNLKEKPDKDTK